MFQLTLRWSLLPYGYSCKASCAKNGFCNFWHPGTLTLSPERQSARMSKITNEGLTRSGIGCFIAALVYHMATVGVKGLTFMVYDWLLVVPGSDLNPNVLTLATHSDATSRSADLSATHGATSSMRSQSWMNTLSAASSGSIKKSSIGATSW